MIGSFFSRSLILAFGYAYPAFLCFKTVEKNKVEIQELRFWCQYWILVGIIAVAENFTDIFISWLPLYQELKLALFIYLWHPSTKGTCCVYERVLRPFLSKHETTIDRNIMELRERAWNLFGTYSQKLTATGFNQILQIFQMIIAQTANVVKTSTQSANGAKPSPQSANVAAPGTQPQNGASQQQSNGATPPTPPSTPLKVYKKINSDKRKPPIPPGTPTSPAISQTPRSSSKLRFHSQAQVIRPEDVIIPDSDMKPGLPRSDSDDHLHVARLKLRHIKPN